MLARALLVLMLPLAARAEKTCGETGAVAARLADCKKVLRLESRKVVNPGMFNVANHSDPLYGLDEVDHVWLVASAKDYRRVMLDEASGLLWVNLGEAKASGEAACDEARTLFGIAAFRLPARAEVDAALDDAMRGAVSLDRGVFFLADDPKSYLDGDAGKIVPEAAAKATGHPRSALCVAPGAKPKPVKKKNAMER